MPATKDQPNLRLMHHMPPLGGVGDVIPGHAVPDPDALQRLGAVEWTEQAVTKDHPPFKVPTPAAAKAELVADLATARAHAEQVADEKLKVEARLTEVEKELADLKAQLAKKGK